MLETGIDLEKFKKWLLENVGEKCEDYDWDCYVCRSWRIFEELKAYMEYNEMLEEIDVEGKEVRPHENGRGS